MKVASLFVVSPLILLAAFENVPAGIPAAASASPVLEAGAASQAFVCPKKKSVVLSGGGSTSSPTSTCGNGVSCGYVFTYNPPRTECQTSELEVCCVEQVQYGYTQTFSCLDHDSNPSTPTICLGGGKVFFGSPHVVLVTVDCTATECRNPPADY